MTILSDKKEVIFSRVFARQEWQERMSELGFITLLTGSHIKKVAEEKPVSGLGGEANGRTSSYLALGLATEKSIEPLGLYPGGFPYRDLFFECLRPWKWLNEDRYDILIIDTNIQLNISEYYRQAPGTGRILVTHPADVSQLTDGPCAAGEKESKSHTTYVIANGDENPARIRSYCVENHRLLFVLFELWGEDRLFFFTGSALA